MVHTKMNNVIKALGKVEDDGQNNFSNYKYISGNKMNSLLRDLLPVHGLSITSEVIDSSEINFTNEKGKIVIRTTVHMLFTVTDTETNESIKLKFSGADQDTGGKSYGQAVTEATKRFQLKNFFVSNRDETDPDSKTVEAVAQKFDVAAMVKHFAGIGVDKLMLETRYNLSDMSEKEIKDSHIVYTSIKKGGDVNEFFNAQALR